MLISKLVSVVFAFFELNKKKKKGKWALLRLCFDSTVYPDLLDEDNIFYNVFKTETETEASEKLTSSFKKY